MRTSALTSASWVINRHADLVWLIGPAVVSFGFLGLYVALTLGLGVSSLVAVAIIYFSWSIPFDATHVFATYTRTYFDPVFRCENPGFCISTIVLPLLGPALILLQAAVLGTESARALALVFFRFAMVFAFWHLARQHWGILVLYSQKNGINHPIVRRLDGALLAMGLVYPFIHAQFFNMEPFTLAERLGVDPSHWSEVQATLSGLAVIAIVAAILANRLRLAFWHPRPARFLVRFALLLAGMAVAIELFQDFGSNAVLWTLDRLLGGAFAIAVVVYVIACALGWPDPRIRCAPKLLFFVVVLLTNNIVLHLQLPIIMYFACLTVFHDIQYLGIVRYYNTNKYTGKLAIERYGFAAVLAQRTGLLVGISLLFAVCLVVPRASNEILNTDELSKYVIGALFWVVAFNHYLIDAQIWKVSGSRGLTEHLRTTPTGEPSLVTVPGSVA